MVNLALEADDYFGGSAEVYGFINAKTGAEFGKGTHLYTYLYVLTALAEPVLRDKQRDQQHRLDVLVLRSCLTTKGLQITANKSNKHIHGQKDTCVCVSVCVCTHVYTIYMHV